MLEMLCRDLLEKIMNNTKIQLVSLCLNMLDIGSMSAINC